MEVRKGILHSTLDYFVARSPFGAKFEIRFQRVKLLLSLGFLVFVTLVLFLPSEQNAEFQVRESTFKKKDKVALEHGAQATSAERLWAAPSPSYSSVGSRSQNTTMILNQKGGNAKNQLRPGLRIPLRILDRFSVGDSSVPVLAESLLKWTTESGLELATGTKLYGEASHEKDSDRASIRFTQISLPSGEIKKISGLALGKDGQPGVPGKFRSDAVKNTTGQMITTFVAGFASGSMQTDLIGGSRGGVQNGMLNAVATTAKERAQGFGEKLKNERQWVEVKESTECDITFSESLNLQMGGDEYGN